MNLKNGNIIVELLYEKHQIEDKAGKIYRITIDLVAKRESFLQEVEKFNARRSELVKKEITKQNPEMKGISEELVEKLAEEWGLPPKIKLDEI